jgi:hypothetical protein
MKEESFMVKSIFGFNCLSSEGQPWLIGPNWGLNDLGGGQSDLYRVNGEGDETRHSLTSREAKRFLRDRPNIPSTAEQREFNSKLRFIFPE